MKGLSRGTINGVSKGLYAGTYMGAFGGGNSNTYYISQAETLAWINQLSLPKPSSLYKMKVDFLIKNLKEFGIWNQLDRLWVFSTEQQAHARVSLVNPSGINSAWPSNITEVNNPTWTRLKGYTGNGTSAYLNTNYTESTNGINATQNNVSTGIWCTNKAITGSTEVDFGSNNGGSEILSQYWNGNLNAYVNSASGGVYTGYGNTLGLTAMQRTSSSSINILKNGVVISTPAENSTGVATTQTYIMTQNVSGSPQAGVYSTRRYSIFFIGSGNINQVLLYNILQRFAMEIGFYA